MKYLHIDEQTMDDLAIFGKNGKPSVYDLYNKTVTQGGSSRLEHIFRHPLSDEQLINEAAAVYQFFSNREYWYPVESETISALAYYLENQDVRTQMQTGKQSVGQLFKDMVATDADQLFARDGIFAAIRVFQKVHLFIGQIENEASHSAYVHSFNTLKTLMNDDDFSELKKMATNKTETKLAVGMLAELDKLIRFQHREKMIRLLDILYELDISIAVGQVARNKGFHFANALPNEGNMINAKQLYHPHVPDAIPNDFLLNTEHNVLFLTGANMAGKSTLMKSIGVALYLGHMGFPVAAGEFNFSVKDGIVTSINLADNLNTGASHYYAEVLRVKEVAIQLKAKQKLLVIFDELFRGTNVKDAYDATIAITTAFCNKRSSQFVISTHIMEAGEILQQQSLPIKYQFLPTVMNGNSPVYTRILKEGITADRQGMIIIQNEGILDMLDAGLKEIEN